MQSLAFGSLARPNPEILLDPGVSSAQGRRVLPTDHQSLITNHFLRPCFFILPSAFTAAFSPNRYSWKPLVQEPVDAKKKALRISSGALLCRAEDALVNFNKVRIARADHSLRIDKTIHVNRDPAVVHEHEVRTADQPEMARPESLDEELFRVPAKTEHFAVTRLELLHVHLRRLIHVRLARARTRARFIPVYVLSATLNVRLSTDVSARLRFRLRFALLLRGTHLLPFRWRSSLRFVRLSLPLRLLRL